MSMNSVNMVKQWLGSNGMEIASKLGNLKLFTLAKGQLLDLLSF